MNVNRQEIRRLAKIAGLKAELKPKEFNLAVELFAHLVAAHLSIAAVKRLEESPLYKALDQAAETPEFKRWLDESTAKARGAQGG